MELSEAVDRLSSLVTRLHEDGITSKPLYRAWAKEHEHAIEQTLAYTREPGMPSVTSLVVPHFHAKLPLVGLNYTQVAHGTLYKYPQGWTLPIRLCRGSVFDTEGTLVALAFPKFFNRGEHPETLEVPNEPWTATAKHDGHLGICFMYKDQPVITTRGAFEYKTAKYAMDMLKRQNWMAHLTPNITALVEIIHPETKVFVDYEGHKRCVLIGAYDTQTFRDYPYDDLVQLALTLGVRMTERWTGNDLEELIAHMKDHSVHNKEGYVVRFESGLRMKLKYESYLALMIGAKISPSYLMHRLLAGDAKSRMLMLEEEVYDRADAILKSIRRVNTLKQKKGETPHAFKRRRIDALFMLEPDPAKRTTSYRQLCGKYVASLAKP